MRIAQPVRREFEYIRHGTLCLMGAYDVRRRKLFGFVSEDHNTETFVDLLDLVDHSYPEGEGHIICDNLAARDTDDVWDETRCLADRSGAWPLAVLAMAAVLSAPLWLAACATSSCDDKLSCQPWRGADAQTDGQREAQTSDAPADAGAESAKGGGETDAGFDGPVPEHDSGPDASPDAQATGWADAEEGSTLEADTGPDVGTDSGTDDDLDSSAETGAPDAAGLGADSSDGSG